MKRKRHEPEEIVKKLWEAALDVVAHVEIGPAFQEITRRVAEV